MTLFSTPQALGWLSASARGAPPPGFAGVSTDTRTLRPGDLFVALKGEAFDGHAFLATAQAAGAAGAVVSRADALPGGLYGLVVSDTLTALGALARGYRLTLAPRLVAVTGSVGKTSAKELLAAALRPLGPVLKTEGNFNNEVGLPLTLFKLRAEHRAAAIEMGMNHAGEIARLAAIAQPEAGIVLNARGVHLEQLGTVENVAKAKAELYAALPAAGVAVANADDPLVLAEARRSRRKLITFGEGEADVRLLSVDDRGLRGVALRARAEGHTWDTRLAMLGAHNALNACAAVAGAMAVGVKAADAVEALKLAHPAAHRLELVQLSDAVTLLDDCYNASPSSMRAALATLRQGAEGRRCGAILGDMLELGPTELQLHREVGTACGGLAWLLCFGPRAAALAEGARAAGVAAVAEVQDLDDGLKWVHAQLRAGDAVLLKGSRGMRLERFAHALGAPERGEH